MKPELSTREKIVATMRASGLTVKEIAEQLGRKIGTIETQLLSIHRKLGVRNAVELSRRMTS